MFEVDAIVSANFPVLLSSIGWVAWVVDPSSLGLFTLFQNPRRYLTEHEV